MDPRNFSVWPIVFFSLFSLTPAGPTGRRGNSHDQDAGLSRGWGAYRPHMGLNNNGNRVRKNSEDAEPAPLLRHGVQPGVKNKHDNTEATDADLELWEKIEHKVLHHLRRTEEKLMEHMEEKASRLNHSITINYLYKVHHYLIEEIEIGKQIGEMRAGEIEKVRKIALDQGKEIRQLQKSLHGVNDLANSLKAEMEELRTHGKVNDGVTSYPSEPTATPSMKTHLPIDCQEVYELGGMKYEGDYFIQVQPQLTTEPFEVCCRMVEDEGWTIIQRRFNGEVEFYRNWDAYKEGFGDIKLEFWLGNDHIHELTSQGDYKLRIEMTDYDGRQHYAEYDHFKTLDEDHNYKMHVHGYRGNAGDSLTPAWNNHDGQMFSTYDRDNDDRYYDNCAERFHGAWWFKSCFESHLNGKYYDQGSHDDYFQQNGVQWNTVGHHYSLRSVVMMVKPNTNVQDVRRHDDHVSNDIQ